MTIIKGVVRHHIGIKYVIYGGDISSTGWALFGSMTPTVYPNYTVFGSVATEHGCTTPPSAIEFEYGGESISITITPGDNCSYPETDACEGYTKPVIPEDPTPPTPGTCGTCLPDGETPVHAPRVWEVYITDSDVVTVDGASINGGWYQACLWKPATLDGDSCEWVGYISCKTHGGANHDVSKCFVLRVIDKAEPFYASYRVVLYDNVGNVLTSFFGEYPSAEKFDCDNMPVGYPEDSSTGYCAIRRNDEYPDVCFVNPDSYPWGPDIQVPYYSGSWGGLPVQSQDTTGFYLSHEANPPYTEEGEYQTVCGGCQPTEIYLTLNNFTDESDEGDCGSKVGPTAATINGQTFALQKVILPGTYADPAFVTGCQYDFLSQIEAPFLIGGNAAVYIYQEQDEEENYLDWALMAYIHRKYDASVLTLGAWLMVRSQTAMWDTVWYVERRVYDISCMTIDELFEESGAAWEFTINEDYETSLCAGINSSYEHPELPATSLQWESGETCWCEDEE